VGESGVDSTELGDVRAKGADVRARFTAGCGGAAGSEAAAVMAKETITMQAK
jgi:hypothetical protein